MEPDENGVYKVAGLSASGDAAMYGEDPALGLKFCKFAWELRFRGGAEDVETMRACVLRAMNQLFDDIAEKFAQAAAARSLVRAVMEREDVEDRLT